MKFKCETLQKAWDEDWYCFTKSMKDQLHRMFPKDTVVVQMLDYPMGTKFVMEDGTEVSMTRRGKIL